MPVNEFDNMRGDSYDMLAGALADAWDAAPDSAAVDACLAELEKRWPPEPGIDAAASLAAFHEKHSQLFAQAAAPRRRRRLRAGLAAAVLVLVSLLTMITAQAFGYDAFGAVARWTESIFSFASDSAGADADGDVPPGYSDIYPLLVERGLTKYTLDVPDGFVLTDIYFDIRDATGDAKFTLLYTMDDNYISYTIDRNSSTLTTVYEKDDNPVEGFEADGVTHHIFTNLDSATAVWLIEDLEFSISSSLGASAVADMVRSFYPAAIGG